MNAVQLPETRRGLCARLVSRVEGPGPSAAPAHNESLGMRFVRPAGLINEGRRRRPPNHERCRGQEPAGEPGGPQTPGITTRMSTTGCDTITVGIRPFPDVSDPHEISHMVLIFWLDRVYTFS